MKTSAITLAVALLLVTVTATAAQTNRQPSTKDSRLVSPEGIIAVCDPPTHNLLYATESATYITALAVVPNGC